MEFNLRAKTVRASKTWLPARRGLQFTNIGNDAIHGTNAPALHGTPAQVGGTCHPQGRQLVSLPPTVLTMPASVCTQCRFASQNAFA